MAESEATNEYVSFIFPMKRVLLIIVPYNVQNFMHTINKIKW